MKNARFNHRTSISDSIKEILYGKDYKSLREAGNVEEMRIIDNDYISRIDRLKALDHPVSLSDIKAMDTELYNAYVEYLSRTPQNRLDEQALLRNNWHNEVILNDGINIDGFMIKASREVGSVYDANANIPKEFFELTNGGKIPLIICK